MGLPNLWNLCLLPLTVIRQIFKNCSMTFSQIFFQNAKSSFHKRLVDIADVNEENKYMRCLLQGGVGDPKYFWSRLKAFIECAWNELMMTAEENGRAPNTTVIRMSDRKEARLLDFARAGRPLVVNFGSCT